LYKTVKTLQLAGVSEDYGVVEFCAVGVLPWAGYRLILSHHMLQCCDGSFSLLEANTSYSHRSLTFKNRASYI